MDSLSNREAQIVDLAIQGLTNAGIANKLGISTGTVNTYWIRIRSKVGGIARTDTVARIIRKRDERTLRVANCELFPCRRFEHDVQALFSLLSFAMERHKSIGWATDLDLRLTVLANGAQQTRRLGVVWEVGRTVSEIFQYVDPQHRAVAAHMDALQGQETTLRLNSEFGSVTLHVAPLRDESQQIMGCIGFAN